MQYKTTLIKSGNTLMILEMGRLSTIISGTPLQKPQSEK